MQAPVEHCPDGLSAWDRLPVISLYRPHPSDSIAPTSHGGGTMHAFGVKVPRDSYGKNRKRPLTSASGKPYSVMREALEAGMVAGIVNSGHLAEPGTGTQLISFTTGQDLFGGVLAKAEGFNSSLIPQHLNNTDVFKVIHKILFGPDRGLKWRIPGQEG